MQKNWTFPSASFEAEATLHHTLGIGTLLARALVARGLGEPEAAAAFLQEQPAPFYDPFLFKDMDKAVRRIKAAVAQKEHITVYGDYDADGVCATSLLLRYFRSIGIEADYYIPSRITEGYGMNIDAVHTIHARGTTLIITVDTGITAIAEVEAAKALGMDVIVTDHHNFSGEVPDAVAVIRSGRPGDCYPFGELCGAGVAFKLISALSDESPEQLFDTYGDQVAIATVADLVPLLGENRAIVRRALKKMRYAPSFATAALLRSAGFEDLSTLSSTDIAYYISPMINAAGRIASADAALALFMADNAAEADACAAKLIALNQERRSIEGEVSKEAETLVSQSGIDKDDIVLVVENTGWHCGVVGIVAARLVDRYHKPVIVLSTENGISTGSGRSVEGFDLYDAVSAHADMLLHSGGHCQAVGLTLQADTVSLFRERINQYAREHYPDGLLPLTLHADGVAQLSELSIDTIEELERLAPFGSENPAPVFIFKDITVKSSITLKEGKHLKMNVTDGTHAFDSIGFSMGSLHPEVPAGATVSIAARPDINCFRERRTPQLKLSDIKPSTPKQATAEDCAARAELRRYIGGCYSFLRKLSTPYSGTYKELSALLSRSGISFSEPLATASVAVLSELKLLEIFIKNGQIELYPISTDKKLNLEDSPSFCKLLKYADHYLPR